MAIGLPQALSERPGPENVLESPHGVCEPPCQGEGERHGFGMTAWCRGIVMKEFSEVTRVYGETV